MAWWRGSSFGFTCERPCARKVVFSACLNQIIATEWNQYNLNTKGKVKGGWNTIVESLLQDTAWLTVKYRLLAIIGFWHILGSTFTRDSQRNLVRGGSVPWQMGGLGLCQARPTRRTRPTDQTQPMDQWAKHVTRFNPGKNVSQLSKFREILTYTACWLQ